MPRKVKTALSTLTPNPPDKAYAAQPDVAAKLKEFKVVSTGEDVAAQIAAVNNFIDSG